MFTVGMILRPDLRVRNFKRQRSNPGPSLPPIWITCKNKTTHCAIWTARISTEKLSLGATFRFPEKQARRELKEENRERPLYASTGGGGGGGTQSHTSEKIEKQNTGKERKSSVSGKTSKAWKKELFMIEVHLELSLRPLRMLKFWSSFSTWSAHHGTCTMPLDLLLLPHPLRPAWTSTAHALITSMAPSERDGIDMSFEVALWAIDGRTQTWMARVANKTTARTFIVDWQIAVSQC